MVRPSEKIVGPKKSLLFEVAAWVVNAVLLLRYATARPVPVGVVALINTLFLRFTVGVVATLIALEPKLGPYLSRPGEQC